MRYMQGTKDYMLTYRRPVTKKLLVVQVLILPVGWIVKNPRQVMCSHLLEDPYREKAPNKR
jgi:hypothetical protein